MMMETLEPSRLVNYFCIIVNLFPDMLVVMLSTLSVGAWFYPYKQAGLESPVSTPASRTHSWEQTIPNNEYHHGIDDENDDDTRYGKSLKFCLQLVFRQPLLSTFA